MTQAEKLYYELREDILSLELRPGERLSERAIEAQYGGASRTPIRAALSRLEADRLVHRNERAWTVMPLSIAQIEQAFEFRIGIEREGVALACARAAPEAVDRVAENFVPKQADITRRDWLRSGRDFHVELMRLSGNEFYVDAMEDVMLRLARLRWLEIVDEAGRARTIIEHREILRHVRAGDVAAAQAAVTRHAIETQRRHQDTLAAAAMRSGSLVIGGGSNAG